MMNRSDIAMEISDATGLPLSDVLDTMQGERMDENALEMLLWDYPGSGDEESEEAGDHLELMDDEVGTAPDFTVDILESDITGHSNEEYRRDAWMERNGVVSEGEPGDERTWA